MRQPSVRGLGLGLFGALLLTASGQAATPESYAALDRQSASACIRAANLRDALVGPALRFSDTTGVDARVVSGVYPQPHMKGARGTMLCLYDRRTRRAEVQEAPADFATAGAELTRPIKDVWWVAADIGGRGVVDNSRVTLMLGSTGRVAGRSGCNQYSGRYTLDVNTLSVSGLVGTRMACAPALMQQEARFQDILAKGRTVAVAGDGSLMLTASDGRTVRFMPEEGATASAPAFQTLRCGGEQFRVSFRPDRAVLETEDGSQVELPSLDDIGDPAKPRRYTNGRVTFERTTQGTDRGVRFARGRAAFIRCQVAQN